MATSRNDPDPNPNADRNADRNPSRPPTGLRQIRGIGITKQQWLRGLAGIRTLEDLAAASAEDLATRLQAGGHPVSQSELADWIAQAQALLTLAASDRPSAPTSEPSPPPSSPDFRLPTSGVLTSDLPTDWVSVAAFTIDVHQRSVGDRLEYRTLIQSSDGTLAQAWDGLQLETALSWVQEQVQPLGSTAPERAGEVLSVPVEVVPSDGELLTVEVSALEIPAFDLAAELAVVILQIRGESEGQGSMIVDTSQRIFPSAFLSASPLNLEVTFCLHGLDQNRSATLRAMGAVTGTVQAAFCDRTSRAITTFSVTAPQAFSLDDQSQSILLSGITLGPGFYRLQVVVSLQVGEPSAKFPVVTGAFKVPLVQVI